MFTLIIGPMFDTDEGFKLKPRLTIESLTNEEAWEAATVLIRAGEVCEINPAS